MTEHANKDEVIKDLISDIQECDWFCAYTSKNGFITCHGYEFSLRDLEDFFSFVLSHERERHKLSAGEKTHD